MNITFTASPMSKPDDLSLKASLAWDYYRINNGGWCCAEADNGDGGIIVTDEARSLNDAFIFPDYDSFIDWLEADAEEKLADDPADYLRACGVVPDNLLSDSVVQALLATINAPDNAPENPDTSPVSAAEKPEPPAPATLEPDASEDGGDPDLQDYFVTFSVVGTVNLAVEASCLEVAKHEAKLDFDEMDLGGLEVADYNILTVEDDLGHIIYKN